MAASSSSSNPPNNNKNVSSVSINVGFEPNSPTNCHTTFVQADPSNFRAVVQKLTGASPDPSAHKLPVTLPARSSAAKPAGTEMGPRRPPFKLQERMRQSGRNLEIKLNNNSGASPLAAWAGPSFSALSPRQRMVMMMMMNNNTNCNTNIYVAGADQMQQTLQQQQQQQVMVSPVSPLDLMLARGSPRTPMEEEEERAIADKGFFLHPSPLTTPRATEPPELLPLFPLHSPTQHHHSSSHPS